MERTIGIFGGGQLGRMMAQAALPLGIECIFLEQQKNCPAQKLGQIFELKDIEQFKQKANVFTLEFENTNVADVECLTLYPPSQALATAQNRILEKTLFQKLDIPVAPFLEVNNFVDLQKAVDTLKLPIVLKTATGGYDGKGQFQIHHLEQLEEAWTILGQKGQLIAEGFVHFSRELSIIAVRGQNGDVKTWPLAQNHHHQGILSHSIVPAPHSEALQPIAEKYITQLLNYLDYVGVLTLELFVTDNGLVANEIAPRVHNSGHWSIEGAVCSQFENHIRAVAGLPLGSTNLIQKTVMVNIIGQYPCIEKVLALEGTHLHLYGKTEATGRKIGHITLMPKDENLLTDLCQRLAKILPVPLALTENMTI